VVAHLLKVAGAILFFPNRQTPPSQRGGLSFVLCGVPSASAVLTLEPHRNPLFFKVALPMASNLGKSRPNMWLYR
jgi:hypothetical protein